MSTASRVTTRDAIPADASAISTLARQLGYDVSPITAANRLVRLPGPGQRVIVAAGPDGTVIGWTSAAVTEHIHSDPHVEISGFVVEEAARGRGVGRALMTEVERWTRAQGLATLRLNANVTRTGAHQFYEKLGFTRTKQQVAFRKELKG